MHDFFFPAGSGRKEQKGGPFEFIEVILFTYVVNVDGNNRNHLYDKTGNLYSTKCIC
jgi:hypothetical protein